MLLRILCPLSDSCYPAMSSPGSVSSSEEPVSVAITSSVETSHDVAPLPVDYSPEVVVTAPPSVELLPEVAAIASMPSSVNLIANSPVVDPPVAVTAPVSSLTVSVLPGTPSDEPPVDLVTVPSVPVSSGLLSEDSPVVPVTVPSVRVTSSTLGSSSDDPSAAAVSNIPTPRITSINVPSGDPLATTVSDIPVSSVPAPVDVSSDSPPVEYTFFSSPYVGSHTVLLSSIRLYFTLAFAGHRGRPSLSTIDRGYPLVDRGLPRFTRVNFQSTQVCHWLTEVYRSSDLELVLVTLHHFETVMARLLPLKIS